MEQIEIDYCPFPYQVDLHTDDRRFRVIVGGRRVGKSMVALQEILVHCLTTPNALAWWIAPTYRDAKEVGFEMFMEYFETLRPAIKYIHQTTLTVAFANGAKLLFKGSDNPDSLRGRGLSYVVMDEAAFCEEDVWTKALRPALSDKKGKALFTSTPNGRNWYYHLWRKANAPSVQALISWNAYNWPTSRNPIIGDAEIADAKENLCDIDFRQEYLAEFVTKAGMIYDDFSEANVIKDFTIDKFNQTYYLGMDFGFANPTAIAFLSVDNASNVVTQFDEIYVTRTPINKISDLIRRKLNEYNLGPGDVTQVYSDPAGNAEELSSGISPVDYLRDQGLRVTNIGTRVAPGLALVRSYILNANGNIRYFVHERCKNTIRSFYGYSYKLGIFKRPTEEPDKDNVHDHMCDAVRYFFVNKFDRAKYVFSDLEQVEYGVDKPKVSRTMKRCGECRRTFLSHTPKTKPPFHCKECLNEH